jgi:hypothetical protein
MTHALGRCHFCGCPVRFVDGQDRHCADHRDAHEPKADGRRLVLVRKPPVEHFDYWPRPAAS